MANNNKQLRILITGGGTGGHVFPAIAIADAIKKLRPDTEFLFVGANGKMEMDRVPQAGYAIEGLNIAGFQRSASWKNLSFPFKLVSSLWKARKIIRRFQPDVVVGTGGYASGPVMRAAQGAGIPTLIQEQNSYAGVTNKILGKRASKICVAYDHMEQFFLAEKIVFSGNPVRSDILNLEGKHQEGIKHYGLNPRKKTIAVIGGSMGARTLNEAMRDNAKFFEKYEGVQALWQCGKFYEYEFTECDTAKLENVQLLPFIDRMDLLFAAADVVISRAGALTISELCLVGKPVVLVPSPNVAEDHQTKNALALVEKGAARLVRDAEAKEKMLQEALLILENEALAFSLSESIRQLGRPNAAEAIAREVIKLAERTGDKPAG
ncbi:MAG: undecaprenyldiphospho-muramoylpentapeptide beta-N-acetylglucosaminyltransferase [Haliscomenobacteraceae bacterium CHB4]|nr:undecaprenyldiphospho-muramoylpentapeptide beta-N-acetylglucosaminyltransferase [Haliscomenobacteraceae bacterium CHB4]